VNDITLLLIPINSRDLIIQLCGTLSKAFWQSIHAKHKLFYLRLHSCSIVFEISSWSLHPFDQLQHPFCFLALHFHLPHHHNSDCCQLHRVGGETSQKWLLSVVHNYVASHQNSDWCHLITVVWRAITISTAVSCTQWHGESSQEWMLSATQIGVASHQNSDCCQLHRVAWWAMTIVTSVSYRVAWRVITIVTAVSYTEWCGESSQ